MIEIPVKMLINFMYNKPMAKSELELLIEEFLDAAGITPELPGLGLSFDTNIRRWEREDAEELLREFINFMKSKDNEEND